MPDTLRSLRSELQLEARGDFAGSPDEDSIVNAAINDAIESIWSALMSVHLARFFGSDSPVTFQLPANTERLTLVGIQDPTVAPVVAQVAGGNLTDAARFFVAYTYVTESGTETNLSPTTQTAARINDNLFQVTPPANPGNPAGGASTPGPSGGAFGYNVYAGPTANEMALQNQQPLPFNVNYTEPLTEWQGYPVNQQAPPLSNNTGDNMSWIEHMEFRDVDNVLRSWGQYDIHSSKMQAMAASIPSASQYQNYLWDLTNDGTLEFRPMTGLAFSPRYWYVARPRRLRYDQAQVPYVNITGVHKFLKAQAKADLYLGINEFLLSQGWGQKAEQEKLAIQIALMTEQWNKNAKITPYMV